MICILYHLYMGHVGISDLCFDYQNNPRKRFFSFFISLLEGFATL